MSKLDEFKAFNAAMDEVQKKLDENREKQQANSEEQQAEFEQLMAELFKDMGIELEEDPVEKTINDVFARIKAFNSKRTAVIVMTKEIKALEDACPEFAEATKTGFSEEEIKQAIVAAFDALAGTLKIAKLEFTLSNVVLLVKLGKKIKFSQFNGTAVYNYLKDNDMLAQYLEPEFKKKMIYSKAIEIVLKTKTISFNTAVKRAIHEIEQEGFLTKMSADDEEFLDDISRIINPLIDLYIENEMEILSAISSKIK